jgi:hypothetical protein
MDKTTVVISRQWASPEIRIDLNNTEIKMTMPMSQYLESLVLALGNPTLLVTSEQLKKKILAAHNQIVDEMKSSTKHAV